MQFPGQIPFYYPQQQASGGSSAGLISLLLLTPVAIAGGVFLYTFRKLKQGVAAADPTGTMSVDLVAATLFCLKAGTLSPKVVLVPGKETRVALQVTTKTGDFSSSSTFTNLPLTMAHAT